MGALLGLVKALLLVAAGLATPCSGNEQTSGLSLLVTLPIAARELAVGVSTITMGFRGAGWRRTGKRGLT